MTTTLIVSAHPEPTSFTMDWARASSTAVTDLGGGLLWSDLYRMDFDPAERAAHFRTDGPFDPLKAQEKAAADDLFPAVVANEITKIRVADRIIMHFPMWWFAPPAMIKGWTDRCLAHGALHDVDTRFDTGMGRGKEVLFCVSTGAEADECGPDGKEGDARLLLWPLAYTFRYCGYAVKDPVLTHGVHGYFEGADKAALQDRLTRVLATQHDIIADWDTRPTLPFNTDTDFDAAGRLRPDAPSHSPFIRRT